MNLLFSDPPSVIVMPEEVSLNETDDVVLNCTAIGTPQPRYTTSYLTHMFFVLTSIIVSHIFFSFLPFFSFHQCIARVYWNTSSLRSDYTTQKLEAIVTLGNCSSGHCTEQTAVTQILHLRNVTGSDNGYVKCIAENIVGKSDDSSSLLKINCELTILSFQA